jgi:adenylate cyclase
MPPEGLKRKLTAILSADLSGYSLLMRENEEATVRTLTDYSYTLTNRIEEMSQVSLTGGEGSYGQ